MRGYDHAQFELKQQSKTVHAKLPSWVPNMSRTFLQLAGVVLAKPMHDAAHLEGSVSSARAMQKTQPLDFQGFEAPPSIH